MKIKNLLLDMGGVILDVDYNKIIEVFDTYGIDAKAIYTQTAQLPLVDDFEVGKITPAEFRNGIRELVKMDLTDVQIDRVWNSMIGNARVDTIKLLGELKLHYDKILLFSNTNEIHMDFVRRLFYNEIGFDIFTCLFDKAYLSNEVHIRKPHKESFLWVLNDAGIKAEETLFIDDTEKNIIGAKNAGLNTYLLQSPQTLLDLHDRRII
ncbi:MAG: HAD family phosphatase [Bacteroidales bacterium]|nr:HAD family phosphatase [Bacteroidales bacterium]